MDAIGVPRFGLVGVSYVSFVGHRMSAMFPEAIDRVALVCAGVCLEEKDLAEGLFPVARVGEAATLLVPPRSKEVRRLVRLSFMRPPLIMPSCFLWDYIGAVEEEIAGRRRSTGRNRVRS
jgi:pimeloyl-ACP methyl ester carboxylesterase